jgi:hypothetical protein
VGYILRRILTFLFGFLGFCSDGLSGLDGSFILPTYFLCRAGSILVLSSPSSFLNTQFLIHPQQKKDCMAADECHTAHVQGLRLLVYEPME